jgi:glycosyltransferase involved in cell wall biosynthesis
VPQKTEGLKLAYVGRIDPEKGLEEFIELLEQSKFYKVDSLSIFGTGTRVEIIQKRFAAHIREGSVRLEGYMPHRDLWRRLQEVHAMILPSIWCENAPLALVESAANGLPVLVHDIGSLQTFGNEIGNKILFSFDVTSFKQAMDRSIEWLSGDRPKELDIARYEGSAYAEAVRLFISSVTRDRDSAS